MKGVQNPARHEELEQRKTALEAALRERHAGQDRKSLLALPTITAYQDYYRPFGKTYHVLAQRESIAFKGRSIPSVAALVEAMFMAEVDDLLLTAGHDLDSLHLPVKLDVARGVESYTLLRGTEATLKPDDMFMADGAGVISSILYGPDARTQIRSETRNVLFGVYAPEGITPSEVLAHLAKIRDLVRVVSAGAGVEVLETYGAP
jgi:DNA/RNA-binding domain of Phe-tRNA-synthetase-like protein